MLALDGAGGATCFADYAQWEAARDSGEKNVGEAGDAAARSSVGAPAKAPSRDGLDVRRLSYLEKREWDQMEQAILEAEQALAASKRAVDDPAVASDPVALGERWATLQAAQAAVDRLYERWAELEQRQR